MQVADADGKVTFTSVMPGCYSGRWTHIHFEVYPDVESITDTGNAIATSQMALPQNVDVTTEPTGGAAPDGAPGGEDGPEGHGGAPDGSGPDGPGAGPNGEPGVSAGEGDASAPSAVPPRGPRDRGTTARPCRQAGRGAA